jgi:hypothetical protein
MSHYNSNYQVISSQVKFGREFRWKMSYVSIMCASTVPSTKNTLSLSDEITKLHQIQVSDFWDGWPPHQSIGVVARPPCTLLTTKRGVATWLLPFPKEYKDGHTTTKVLLHRHGCGRSRGPSPSNREATTPLLC